MIQRVVDTIGLMDTRGYAFRTAFEKLIAHLDLEIRYQGQLHRVVTRRLRSRPYDVLRAVSPYRAVLNRGDRDNLHFNSYLLTVAPTTYLLNDMVSFLALDKNATYGHMTRLGLRIPPTAALPASLKDAPGAGGSALIFPEQEFFDLREIGEEIGFPAYLKPQVGDQWGEAHRVEDADGLEAAWRSASGRPMNLQRAVETTELVHAMGVGPTVIPMHCDPSAQPEDRFIRSPERAVEQDFLDAETFEEVVKITKVCNAFFNWDHNSCEVAVDAAGVVHPIDFTNVGPDCDLLSLHFYFPDVVKATARWLVFNAVTARRKPPLGHDWADYFSIAQEAQADGWSYEERLTALAELADRHFEARRFAQFLADHLPAFEEQALQFFASQQFQVIIEEEVGRHFRDGATRPQKMKHYMGLHRFWLHCERDRLGLPTGKWV